MVVLLSPKKLEPGAIFHPASTVGGRPYDAFFSNEFEEGVALKYAFRYTGSVWTAGLETEIARCNERGKWLFNYSKLDTREIERAALAQ